MSRFKQYKTIANYNEWRKTHGTEEIYAIVSAKDINEHYFDVTDADMVEMIEQGIVNSEGHYYLKNNPTEEQIAQYAAKYGILWTDKEKPAATIVIISSMPLEVYFVSLTKEQVQKLEDDYDDNVESYLAEQYENTFDLNNAHWCYYEGTPTIYEITSPTSPFIKKILE